MAAVLYVRDACLVLGRVVVHEGGQSALCWELYRGGRRQEALVNLHDTLQSHLIFRLFQTNLLQADIGELVHPDAQCALEHGRAPYTHRYRSVHHIGAHSDLSIGPKAA